MKMDSLRGTMNAMASGVFLWGLLGFKNRFLGCFLDRSH